jgi:hypothetical protein
MALSGRRSKIEVERAVVRSQPSNVRRRSALSGAPVNASKARRGWLTL